MDGWRVTPEERVKHDQQFLLLKPVNGFIKGDQAKGFLMQSGLPGQVLGHIWGLADMNSDGMMDKREFSIAMYLIQKKLQGFELPKVLPDSLKVDPAAGFSSPGGAGSLPGFAGDSKQRSASFSPTVDSVLFYSRTKVRSQSTLMTSPGFAGADWSIPQNSRLRYMQTFQSRDSGRRGYLTGVEARNILIESGLPQHVLAQIWNLSDIDNDGRLTSDEFSVAMYLVESARAGQTIPAVLPAAVVPPSYRSPSGGGMSAGGLLSSPLSGGQAGVLGGLMASPSQSNQHKDALADLMSTYSGSSTMPALPSGAAAEAEISAEDHLAKTFEDRRKENFDRGQAELEKRRAMLREQQKAEEEARLALERAEQEKRERQRLEQERKKQQELEKQMQRQRELEQERDEQRRKAMEQREAARRELERQRLLDWERQRMEQLIAEKNRIQDDVLQLKSLNTNMACELETLDNKKTELATKIQQSTVSVKDITSSIERMRVSRDVKLADIDRLQADVKGNDTRLKRQDVELADLTLQLETNMEDNPVSDVYKTVQTSLSTREQNVNKLRQQLVQIQAENKLKQQDLKNNNQDLLTINNQINSVRVSIQKLLAVRQAQQQKPAPANQQIVNKKPLTNQTSLGQKDNKQSSWFDTFEDKSVFSSSPAPRGGGSADLFSEDSQASSIGPPDDSSWATFAAEGNSAQTDGNKSISQGIWEDAFSNQATAPAGDAAATDALVKKPGVSKFLVLYPFEARHQDELTINPGDIVMVNDDQSGVDQDWMGGEMGGKYGWFPESYVERVTDDTTQPPDTPRSTGAEATNPVDLFGNGKFTINVTVTEPSTNVVTSLLNAGDRTSLPSVSAATSPVPGGGQPAPDGLQAQALYPWRAKKDNHLTFNKGDIINVTEQQDMWWSGEIHGKLGWFPKSYVKLISGPNRQSDSRSDTPVSPSERRESLPDAQITEKTTNKAESYAAIYAYQSNEPGDLSFNQGDVVTVTSKDGDWWTGKIGVRVGIFPANYVQKVDNQPEDLALPVVDSSTASQSPVPPVAEQSASPARSSTPADGSIQSGLKLTKKPEIASVIAAYHATGAEQLSLQPGQLIMIRKRSPSGWWEGELQARGQKKKIGWFPANYVKVLGASSARSTPVMDDNASQRSTPLPTLAEPTQAPPQRDASTTGEQVVSLYPYEAQNADELNLQRNCVINVINKDDPDWWKGELNGQVGLFPANYVKPLGEQSG